MVRSRSIRWIGIAIAFAFVAQVLVSAGWAAASPAPKVDAKAFEQAVTKAVEYLKTKGQAPDGSYSKQSGPAITALVTTAILRNGRGPDDPVVAKSLKFLSTFVRDDGGIYSEGSVVQNYETCLSLMCFVEANRDGRYTKLIKNAEKFLKGLQWDGSEGHDIGSEFFGGAGYGGSKRPDLSNTSFLIEALRAAGDGPEDESLQKALVFVSRCQNLESEHNQTGFPTLNPDGGFYYTPAAGGNSQAGKLDNGGLRSYASMTYAGLKSMIFAGVGREDARVKAAIDWLQKNYNLKTNPGMGDAGLFYYYHTFAKALDAFGEETFQDASGEIHPWRAELAAELLGRQRPDGSWLNDNSRWLEGDANLVTGYALLALAYCKEPR